MLWGMAISTIRVTAWNEGRHEKRKAGVAEAYPKGIHGALAEALEQAGGFDVRTVVLDDPEHGLSEDVVESTDVMLWWGHGYHGEVQDEIVERVHNRVLSGMGIVVLH